MIFAIDPGPEKSGYVEYDEINRIIQTSIICDNNDMLRTLKNKRHLKEHLAIEMIASYGMPVGASVFQTCVWIGRFIQAWDAEKQFTLITRNEVKNALCYSSKAKDSNIRQAIIDLFPATGGGKVPQIGTKGHPGPLYGVAGDMWSALAVALSYDLQRKAGRGEK